MFPCLPAQADGKYKSPSATWQTGIPLWLDPTAARLKHRMDGATDRPGWAGRAFTT